MAREKVRIALPFGSGEDEKSDERTVLMPGQWASVVNGQFNKFGRLQTRAGYATKTRTVDGGLTIAGPVQMLAPYRDGLCSVDNNGFLSAYKTAGTYTRIGRIPEVNVERENVHDSAFSATSCDTCSNGTYVIRTWLTNVATTSTPPNLKGDVYACQYEVATGTPLGAPVLIGTGYSAPKVALVGATFVIVAWDAVNNVYKYSASGVGGSTFTAAATLTTSVAPDTTDGFVFEWIALSDRFLFAYPPAGNNGIEVRTYSTLLAVLATQTITDANCDIVLGLAADKDGSDNIYLIYTAYEAGAVTASAATTKLTNALAITYGPTQLPAGMKPPVLPFYLGVLFMSGGALMVIMSGVAIVSNSGTYTQLLNPANGGALGSTVFTPTISIASRPFLFGSSCYALLQQRTTVDSGGTTIQGTLFILEMGTTAGAAQVRPIATIAPRLAVPATDLSQRARNSLSSVIVSGNTYTTLASVVTDGQYPAGRSSLVQVKATFRNTKNFGSAACGEDLLIGTGTPWLYDGANAFEQGFLLFPEGVTASTAGVGGFLATGTYLYSIVFEYVDARGQRHQSAPSPIVSVTYGGGITTGLTTLTVPSVQLTGRANANIGVVVYRSAVGGTTLYRVTGDIITTLNANQLGTAVFTITDGAADSSITSNPVIYTTAGELPNFCPPSASIVREHKNRTWLAGTDEGRGAWFSKQATFGTAPGFNDALQLYFPHGGRITGLESLDDKLVVFKTDRIFIVYGDGPNNAGAGADWQIQTIVTDEGCINPKSTVVTPLGVMYQGRKGLMLLSRDLQVSFIGAPVEDTTANVTVYSAVLVPKANQVRFTINNGVFGSTLVFDYLVKQWSVWLVYDDQAGATASAQSACVFGDVYHWTGTTGWLYAEDATLAYDGSNAHMVALSAKSGWVKTGTVAGFQRVAKTAFVGNALFNSTISVQLYTDYATTPTSTITLTPPTAGVEIFEQVPVVGKCAAMQVLITAIPTTTATAQQWLSFDLDVWRDTRAYKGVPQGKKG